MQRIDSSNRALNLFGAGKDGFAAGVAALGQLATKWSATWANSHQEELAAIVELTGGLALDPTNLHQAASVLSSGKFGIWTDTGIANAYVVATNPAITAYSTGQRVRFAAAHASTGAATLDAGAGAVAINDSEGNALPSAAITTNAITTCEMGPGGTWQLIEGRSSQNRTLRGLTTLPSGCSIDTNGKLTITSIVSGTLNHLVASNANITVENPTGTCIQIESNSGASTPAMAYRTDNTATPYCAFNYGATSVGSINTTSTATQFITTSDGRLKNIKGAIDDPIGLLMKLRPLVVTFKSDAGETPVHAFIAHELQEHVPQAVSGVKDGEHDIGSLVLPAGAVIAEDVPRAANLPANLDWVEATPAPEDGSSPALGRIVAAVDAVLLTDTPEPAALPPNTIWTKTGRVPVWQGVDHSHLVPLLTAAMQALVDRVTAQAAVIEQLQADVAALKGKPSSKKAA